MIVSSPFQRVRLKHLMIIYSCSLSTAYRLKRTILDSLGKENDLNFSDLCWYEKIDFNMLREKLKGC